MSSSQLPHSEMRPAPPALDATTAAPPPVVDDATVITQRQPGSASGSSRGSPSYELGKLLAGERLNHFELIEYVGGGGMGAVFRARDTMLGREVALKVLSRDQGADDETRRRFQNEAQSAARLDHENIARVYFVGEDRGLNYIVFEFIQGVNLRELVEKRGGPLPLAEALSYTMQISRALEHASSRDVVHRDIKPSNVLITDEGRAKLVDMGLARLHQVNAGGTDLTASGVTLGTFDYISPEQARDPRVADVRSDIYSLGCTLYYMLTARPPFPEGTVLQKLLQHNSDDPPDPREFNPSLPAQVSDVVRRMLAKNPRRRYQTPVELIADLLTLAEATGISTGQWGLPLAASRTPAEEQSFFARHIPWLVPVGLLLVAVVALDLFSGSLPLDRGRGLHSDVTAPTSGQPRKGANRQTATPAHGAPAAGLPAPVIAGKPQLPAAGHSAANNSGENHPLPAAIAGSAIPAIKGGTPPSATPGSTQLAASDTNSLPLADREHLRPGLLVVGDGPTGPQRYASLRAACAEVKSGDVIELRYNGRREERPMTLNNVRFTLRAGEGYRPVVVFRPDEADPVRYPRNMMTVTGGRLVALNVAFELRLPEPEDVPAESWSLFVAERPESLELDSCTLSIVDRGEMAAFFAVQAAAGTDSMMAIDDSMPDEPGTIHLENCLLRGQATVLRVYDGEPVNFSWENGLAIAGDRFLAVSGSPIAPRHPHQLQVSLEHVTAVVGRGFCQIANSFEAPYLRDTEIECSDSILLAMSPCPLVEQHGLEGPATLKRQFSWKGDRNFYDGFDGDRFWLLVDESGTAPIEQLSFLEWVSHWGQQHELLPTWGEIAWNHLPAASKPLAERDAQDYALGDRSSENMAREGASDGRDVGVDPSLLPPIPPPTDDRSQSAASR
ncbi:MAG TPA: protein kinase [Pirellulales bacterium]|nr:protein kinase [Pirellulales bacterium]